MLNDRRDPFSGPLLPANAGNIWLRQSIDIWNLGHYIWDLKEDRCLFASERHAEIHGLSVSEYIERASTKNGVTHPGDLPRIRSAFDKLSKGRNFIEDFRIVLPNGNIRYVREVGYPILDADGVAIQEVGTSRDITSQKCAELAPEVLMEALSAWVENLPVGFAVYDKEGRLEFCNTRYREFLPRSSPILQSGVTIEEVFRRSAENVSAAMGYADAESYLQDRIASFKNPRSDRKWRFTQSSGRLVQLTEHPSLEGGIVSIVEDVTQKNSEQQSQPSKKLSKPFGFQANDLARDFDRVLSYIRSNAELLNELKEYVPEEDLKISDATSMGAQSERGVALFVWKQFAVVQGKF